MTLTEVVYVVAGIAMPAYYVPQMLKCAADKTHLAAYSMSKAASQLGLRAAMLPFVFGIDNMTMTSIVALDFVGRAAEFTVALWSLHRQGLGVRQIALRCLPVASRWHLPAAEATPSDTTPTTAATPALNEPVEAGQGPGSAGRGSDKEPEPSAPTDPDSLRHHPPTHTQEPFHGHHLITFSSGQLPDRGRSRRGADRVRRRGR